MRAKLGLPADVDGERPRAVDRRVASPAEGEPRRLHLVLPPPRPRARGDAESARGLFIDLAGFDELDVALASPGSGRRRHGPRQPASTSRATIWSRRLWPRQRRAISAQLGAASRRRDGTLCRTAGTRALRQSRPGGLRQLPNVLRHLSRCVRSGRCVCAGGGISHDFPPWTHARSLQRTLQASANTRAGQID